MTLFKDKKLAAQSLSTPLLAQLLAMFSLLFLPVSAFAQGLALKQNDTLVPAVSAVTHSAAVLDSEFGAYDRGQIEQLGDRARISQSEGEFQQALEHFKQALHVARINDGLYHESQIPIVDEIIAVEIALRNWESVDKYYAYQEHLYQRLYDMDDPRLEAGLRKVSAWHINALNVNLDGKRIEHLRKANKLFKLRMEIAKNTLASDDPKVANLAQNIKICERELFLASDLNREMMIRQQKDDQIRRKSPYRQSDRRLIVTLD